VRFEPDGIEVTVPTGTTFLEAARACGAQVGSACGGVCACSTCHVYVREGVADLSAVSEREEDIMDKAFDVRATSRLGCQAQLRGERLYVVEISRESRKAFLDEHPELREALARSEAERASGKGVRP
jgi:2Fe-2S ferredoxin